MARKRTHRRRRRRRLRPAESIAGYTRFLDIKSTTSSGTGTDLQTVTFPDVMTPGDHTENRKIVRVAGQAFFTANLAADKVCASQFCLWAHPEQEAWPSVSDYDPFNDGPGQSAFEGMLAPRAFCRRTLVLSTPSSGVAQTVSNEHMIRSKAERLLRPGWILSAGLYTRADSGVSVRFTALLRAVVAG